MPLSGWPYAALIIVILLLLYIIRKYEKNLQEEKLRNEKSRVLKAESDFTKTRKEYLEVLDSLQDGYVETDKDGIISHVNLPFLGELGYSSGEEVVGKRFWDLTRKKYAKDVSAKFEALLETGLAPERFETGFYGKDGRHFIGEVALSPILDQELTVGTKATIRNSTQRFEAEREMAVQKDFLDELLQQTPVAVVIIATNRKISFVNASFEELFGYASREAIGERLENLLSSPEIQEELKECSANYQDERIFLSGRRKTKGGGLTDVEVFAQRFFVGSRNYGHLVFYSDISLRVKAEEVLRMARDLAERDLEMGREMQSGFFPQTLPALPGWDVFTYFNAARQVSGDFYDVFPIGNQGYHGFVVADVCDKGVGAALFMVLLRSLIRSYSEQHQEERGVDKLLHQIAVKVNRYIVETHGQSNMFATLVLGILDPATNRLSYINGGHDAPLLLDTSGNIRKVLEPGGPAFGFTTDLPFEIDELEFLPGELLVAFTDGLTEAKNLAGDFYSDERLLKEVARSWPSAFSTVKHLEVDVRSHIGKQDQFDDITLLALRRCLPGETPSHRFSRKAELTNLPLFRNFVVEACQHMGVDVAITETFRLAVDEVCSNLITHGYKDLEIGEIGLLVKQMKNEIVVEVEDSGHPFDTGTVEVPELGNDITERKIGGLGVFLVKEMVDEMSYESMEGRNFLSLKMRC